MIVRLTGIVSEVGEHTIVLERDGVGHEVLVPGYAIGELAAYRGREVQLYTLEFLEGNIGGAHMVPRLVGFLHQEDRAFFNRFIEVKGIGVRKALKALAAPVVKIAGWIRQGDTASLSKLPGIGKRVSEMMVAELRGKIDEFVGVGGGAVSPLAQWSPAQHDALEIMVAWGDARNDAERWLERTAQLHPDLTTDDEWVRACYRIKMSTEGQ